MGTITVDIDVDDVLHQVSDNVFIKELQKRSHDTFFLKKVEETYFKAKQNKGATKEEVVEMITQNFNLNLIQQRNLIDAILKIL